MKIIAWIIRLCIFTFLLLLAIDNSQPLTLIMPLQIQNITAPTIVILLATFVIGVLFGLLALISPLLSAKNLNRKLQKIIDNQHKNSSENKTENTENIENTEKLENKA